MRKISGQTMLELIMALAVITTGLFAATTLIFSNQNMVDRSIYGITALNLSRENLEIAKRIRDSNWLSGQAFDTGLSGDYTATLFWSGNNAGPFFDFSANVITDQNAAIVRLADPAGFFANKNSAMGTDGEATSFRRLATFYPICDPDNPPNTNNPPVACGIVVGVRVKSEVQWAVKSKTRSTVLYEDLYDWR